MPQLPSVFELMVTTQPPPPPPHAGPPHSHGHGPPTPEGASFPRQEPYTAPAGYASTSPSETQQPPYHPRRPEPANDYFGIPRKVSSVGNGGPVPVTPLYPHQQRRSISSSIGQLSRQASSTLINPSIATSPVFNPVIVLPRLVPTQPGQPPTGLYLPPTWHHQQTYQPPHAPHPPVPHYAPNPPFAPPYPHYYYGPPVYSEAGTYSGLTQPAAGFEANNALLNRRRIIKRRTRTGCLTCRKRRIKCDERKPHCFNCERSKKVCLGYETTIKKKRDLESKSREPGVAEQGSAVRRVSVHDLTN